MKKILAVIALLVVSLTVVGAKSDVFTINGASTAAEIMKPGTHSPLHTAVKATYMNEERITVRTDIQRQNDDDVWVTLDYDSSVFVKTRDLNTAVERNFTSLSGIADTKALWSNKTAGTRMTGQFYINSGLASDSQ